ncbi:MAG: hypothetical protein UY63_C0008G0018 [Parcubacteria group bacterium GW2011_GWA2_51_10]|nr:MAG: hypothetical protein UY63_C0008G0018 [Parcubacteria group bacterium GW2011_GWA2_51_10]
MVAEKQGLTSREAEQLIELLGKLRWPVPENVFYAICENLVSCTVELAVLRSPDDPEILLIERHDKYFDGWHLPGGIQRPGERASETLARIMKEELDITAVGGTPEFIPEQLEFLKGTGSLEVSRGQERTWLFILWVAHEEIPGKQFFSLNTLPSNFLRHHKKIIDVVRIHISIHDCRKDGDDS